MSTASAAKGTLFTLTVVREDNGSFTISCLHLYTVGYKMPIRDMHNLQREIAGMVSRLPIIEDKQEAVDALFEAPEVTE